MATIDSNLISKIQLLIMTIIKIYVSTYKKLLTLEHLSD